MPNAVPRQWQLATKTQGEFFRWEWIQCASCTKKVQTLCEIYWMFCCLVAKWQLRPSDWWLKDPSHTTSFHVLTSGFLWYNAPTPISCLKTCASLLEIQILLPWVGCPEKSRTSTLSLFSTKGKWLSLSVPTPIVWSMFPFQSVSCIIRKLFSKKSRKSAILARRGIDSQIQWIFPDVYHKWDIQCWPR